MRPEGDDVVIDLPRMIAHLQKAGGVQSDADLIGHFLARRDEAAFAALVRRHGPMVLGVCRRVLRHDQDAEDAFQATFWVLAQKASSLLPRESAGPWLYGVAYRVALKAAAAGARRRSRERQVRDVPHPEVAPAEVTDWRPLLDRELSRLSERYRSAVVLCDLEGRTRKEAARLLGVPENTLASRLTRARELLAKRLGGRGVTLSGAALAAALAAEAAAQVPAALEGTTIRVAALVAAGQLAGASAAPVALMRGVMRAMLMQKLKVVAVAVVATAALGVVGLASRTGEEVRAQDAGTPAARSGGKPASEVEALRREVEDLRATVRVLLKEIQALQRGPDAGPRRADTQPGAGYRDLFKDATPVPGRKEPPSDTRGQIPDHPASGNPFGKQPGIADMMRDGLKRARDPILVGEAAEVEDALQALLRAGDLESRRRAAEALERTTRRIRERYGPTTPEKR